MQAKYDTLSGVLDRASSELAKVRQELLDWKRGQFGTPLVHRASYKVLCAALESIPDAPKVIRPLKKAMTGQLLHTETPYLEEYAIHKSRPISRVKRLFNARMKLEACRNVIAGASFEHRDTQRELLAVLNTMISNIMDLPLPGRFEKNPPTGGANA